MTRFSLFLALAAALVVTGSAMAAPPAGSANGVLIKTVVPNSPAAQVGLKSGDRIVSIAGMSIEDSFDMAWAISSQVPGTRLTLQVVREGKPVSLAGTLGRRATMPVSVRPVYNRPAPITEYIYTPADINDQHAFGG